MRRLIHGIGITFLWCFAYYLLQGLDGGIVFVFFSGVSISFLWEIGVSSNLEWAKEHYAKQDSNED